MNRRNFIRASAAGVLSASAAATSQAALQGGVRPVVIASGNGQEAVTRAMQMIKEGADTLDAVIAGVNLVEADPDDMSVGYGGLPNERGVVQLDSSVMHGPTRGAGAVACLEGIKHPSRVARMVMENTRNVLLVGRGALDFALAMGFERENLLTPQARERWIEWKRNLSDKDDWIHSRERLPGGLSEPTRQALAAAIRHHGTINCNAINEKGDISGVTTTSGLAFKIPGRVGDSPIIGAGLFLDNEVGACGSVGLGEANLKTCASFLVVEFMRQGLSPEEAGMRTLQRIAENTVEPFWRDENGRPLFQLSFFALNKKGEFAGTSMWNGADYVAHDGQEARRYPTAHLYQR